MDAEQAQAEEHEAHDCEGVGDNPRRGSECCRALEANFTGKRPRGRIENEEQTGDEQGKAREPNTRPRKSDHRFQPPNEWTLWADKVISF